MPENKVQDGEAQQPCWQAGIARVDITPPLGVWMAGFGFRTKGAETVHDPLYATALVISDGTQEIAIISSDLLSLDAPDAQHVRALTASLTGIDPAGIMVHTTHTHSGPLTSNMRFGRRDAAYESVLFRQMASAAALAQQRLQPVRLTYGTAPATIGINRREVNRTQPVIGDNPDGQVDNQVAVIGIYPPGTGRMPLGIVVRTATHPVVFGAYHLSRDFPGYGAAHLEAAFPGSIYMHLTGTAGDVNPVRMRTEKNRPLLASQLGEMLAGAALQALAAAEELPVRPLVAAQQQVSMPLLPLPPAAELERMYAETRERIVSSGVNVEARLAVDGVLSWAEEALAVKKQEPGSAAEQASFTAELQALVIGDLTLTGLPFETFTDYQYKASEMAPTLRQLVIGYANGDFGYLPTAAAFPEGGYEVQSAFRYYGLQQLAPAAPAVVLQGLAELYETVRRRL